MFGLVEWIGWNRPQRSPVLDAALVRVQGRAKLDERALAAAERTLARLERERRFTQELERRRKERERLALLRGPRVLGLVPYRPGRRRARLVVRSVRLEVRLGSR